MREELTAAKILVIRVLNPRGANRFVRQTLHMLDQMQLDQQPRRQRRTALLGKELAKACAKRIPKTLMPKHTKPCKFDYFKSRKTPEIGGPRQSSRATMYPGAVIKRSTASKSIT